MRTTADPQALRRLLLNAAVAVATFAVTVAGGLAIAPAAARDAGGRSATADTLVPATGRLFGAFVDPAGSPGRPVTGDSQAAVDAFERRLGRSLDLRRVFLRWDDPIDSATVRADIERGRTPVVSVRPQRRDGSRISWADVASGTVDADIAAQARAVRSLGAPVFLSFHHEPDVESTFGSPAQYVAAWRHYVQQMRTAGASGAAFTWIMTPSSFGSASVGAGADAYYPGDDVVDWAGLDAYNWLGCSPGKPAAWRPLAQVVSPFRTFGARHGKPLMLAEWGSVEDPADPGRKAAWLRDGMAALDSMPEIKAVSYFSTRGNCDWWADSSDGSWTAFTEVAADAAAHGRTTASLLADRTAGPGPLTVTFDASASAGTGQRSGQGVAHWEIGFGDGTPAASGTGTPPSAVRHTFPAGTHSVRLTVTDAHGVTARSTRTVTAAPAPTVTGDGRATADTSATLRAWVNTRGLHGDVTFEWGTTTAYGASVTLPAVALGWTQALSTDLTGLAPGTRYHWRVRAVTAAGSTTLDGRSVDTTGPPTVHVDAANRVTSSTATLNARVHPHSLDSVLTFEVVHPATGQVLRTGPVPVAAHTGYRWLSVPVTGLDAGTTYTVRAEASNPSGTASDERTMTTTRW